MLEADPAEPQAFERLYRRGRAPLSAVTLGYQAFASYLERLGISADDPGEHAADLFLACACLEGERKALVHFEAEVLTPARVAVARMRPGDDFADEVLQELRSKLLVVPPKALAGYLGRGPLAAWVRVAATRLAIDALRAAKLLPVARDVPQAFDEQQLDPEMRMLVEGHREAFQTALRAILSELPAKDRNLLRRHMVDGMTLEEMSAPYGVHPATIARRLAALREGIADAVRARLLENFGKLAPEHLESAFRAIRSQVYVSLSPLLGTDPDTRRGR